VRIWQSKRRRGAGDGSHGGGGGSGSRFVQSPLVVSALSHGGELRDAALFRVRVMSVGCMRAERDAVARRHRMAQAQQDARGVLCWRAPISSALRKRPSVCRQHTHLT